MAKVLTAEIGGKIYTAKRETHYLASRVGYAKALGHSNRTGWVIRDESGEIADMGGIEGDESTGQRFINRTAKDVEETFAYLRRWA